jgi:hypothetical protein
MPNKFKYNKTGSEANSIFKGNWAIDTTPANTGGGPTSSTSFYHGANIPAGGYTIYSPTKVFTAADDTQLLAIVSQLGGETGSVNGALSWLSSQSTYIVLNKNFENIVTSNLVLNVDASNISSFVDNEPTVNLLYSSGAVNFTNGAGDIYGNCSKTDLGGGKFRFVNNGAGATTIRLYTNQASLINGATYACSVYFENLYGTIWFDWCDVGITGVNSSSQQSGRLAGYSSRPTYDGPYYFLDIDLSSRGSVTLFNPQVEQKSYVTAFVNGTRTQSSPLYDLSGNNKHGTLTNGPTFNSNGYIVFDGNDDYISILNPLNQSNLSQVWSVTALVKLNAGTGGPQYIIGPNGLNNGVAADWYNAGPLLYLNGGANDYYTYGSGYIGGTGWNHLTYLFDNSTGLRQIYKNGILIGNSAGPNNTSTPSGQGATWTLGQMAGSISSIQVYNRVLSSTEIPQNYYKGPIVTSGLTYMWDAGNLVSYESGSTTAYNLAGSKYATLTNGVGFNKANGGHWTFDGSDDAIFIEGSLYSFSLNQNVNWTVNAWIKTTTTAAVEYGGGILSNSNGGPVYSNLQVNNGRIAYTHYNNSWQTHRGLKTVNDNKWHLLTWANIGNGNMNLYVDGVFDSTIDAQLSSSNAIDVIGRSWAGSSFDGSIASVQINYITMNQDQVTQNFNAQRNRFGI